MVVLPRPPKPHFLQSPLPWVCARLQADLTQAAKLLYALLLDRATLSQANGWLDEGGRIYLVFPIEKIAAALDRSTMTVKTALSELSSYMESTGRSYQNHAATIRRWAENDKAKGVPKQGIPDYTCKEGESL